jgi:hypothetical protein
MKRNTPHPHALATLATAALLTATAAMQAGDPPAVPYPDGFRTWRQVRSIVVGPEHSSFAARGGIHHYYANDRAMEGYRTGTFPDGSVIVDEGVRTTDGEGPAKGILFEGDRRALDVMVKNDRLYKDSGGWGFEHFDGDARAGTLAASGRTTCFTCHAKAKRDHVFSSVRP